MALHSEAGSPIVTATKLNNDHQRQVHVCTGAVVAASSECGLT
jgi:hypothetical protein